ncbi:MAG: DEAD/DEAH box helicase family protein [Alphaproteobacteria bacterium]|nr:DEAD/DEAH box helicase family protein [Alphaproteobacteria bacterium]
MTPEQQARQDIDAQLLQAGWIVQDARAINLGAGRGVAVREYHTDAGPADYVLFLDGQAAGIIEAKPVGTTLASVEAQTLAYAASLPAHVPAPVRPLPFLFESTGAETWFTDRLAPISRSRRVFSFFQPRTLAEELTAEAHRLQGRPSAPAAATLVGRMRQAPPLNTVGMWPAQIRAVQNLETSIREGRRRALIQMATGAGKTYTTVAALYRLIRHGGARRVLFLVDRANLGEQALTEFEGYTAPDDGRKFSDLYNVVHLTHNTVGPINKVVISTIQRLYSILQGEPELDPALDERSAMLEGPLITEPPPVVYSPHIPPEFFDVIVVDECHRSIYSLWRQVLEYFDAQLIGLTATPDARTFAFFRRNVVSEYRHEHAVRDRVNVPYEVYEIRTRIGENGSVVASGGDAVIGKRDRQTRQVRWEAVDEDITYTARQLDRSVVALDQIRTVVRELRAKMFTEIFPGRTTLPKTLFFAKSDSHADDILRVVREEFGLSNEEAVKITYKTGLDADGRRIKGASKRPGQLIKDFRTRFNPRVAVTVDKIATGTDVKPLECVVFMRTVKSRGLFEQMKGRGVRVMNDTDFQTVTPDAKRKTHFVLVDCVGVCESPKTDPPLIRERSATLKQLLDRVAVGDRRDETLATLAGRLDRMERQLDGDQTRQVEEASGGVSLLSIVGGLIECIDADREDARAREIFQLSPDQAPTEAQLQVAQRELRDGAAAVLAHNPTLREVLLEVRRLQEQLIDAESLDAVVHAGRARDREIDYDQQLVASFETFIEENKDRITALQVLYARPYAQRLTRAQLRELAEAIEAPPRSWTPDRLWAAYERLQASRVRGSGGQVWTDIVSLARHALHPTEDLVPFAETVAARFENWLAQQQNTGRRFTEEQLVWLRLIAERIGVDAGVRVEDLQDSPFFERGGLTRGLEVFGGELEEIVTRLNEELVA